MTTADIEFFAINVERADWKQALNHLGTICSEIRDREEASPSPALSDEQNDGPSTLCWLAYGANKVPMGAATLGRGGLAAVAVAPQFRRRDVGSALLRHVVRHALTQGLDHLAVAARPGDRPFYHLRGFVSAGDQRVGDEINDEPHHQAMRLPLHRFKTLRTIAVPSPITAAERRRHRLKGALDFQQAALALAARATRKLRILSHHLDPDIYDNAAFCERVLDLAIHHRDAEIQILLRNPRTLVQTGHRLLQLHRRLPSRIKIRRFNINCQTPHNELMLIDSSGILYNSVADGYSGYEIRSSPADTTALARDFDTLWAAGEADAELREMLI